MRLTPQDRALIVNALREKAEGDRKGAAIVAGDYANTAAHLTMQAERADIMANDIEAGEPISNG